MQFYILMIDYGKGPERPMGLEAVSSPEKTRRDIINDIREINIAPRGRSVAFVKYVDGNYIEDISADMLAEAEQVQLEAAE